jgi:peptide-methionine (S)-S-oxide reductase
MNNSFQQAADSTCTLVPSSLAALPDPLQDDALSPVFKPETVVLAGGCFWGVEAVFRALKGVQTSVSGYVGGDESTAHYTLVSQGDTGHAEAVEVSYDAAQITLGKILKVFFSVAHDPTQLNRQGPDVGTQYRSAIFFTTPEQEKIAKFYIDQLNAANAFPSPIVTELAPLRAFYRAEDYHQDYVARNPSNPYVAHHDIPKVAALRRLYPDLCQPSDEEWKKTLDPQQYSVLRCEGTERAFTSPLNNEKREGTFTCAGCGQPLFTSESKFDSGTGWPSFFEPMPGSIQTKTDHKLATSRTEYHCATCGGHQGHVFPDGPEPTGLRYCNNGIALKFIPKGQE